MITLAQAKNTYFYPPRSSLQCWVYGRGGLYLLNRQYLQIWHLRKHSWVASLTAHCLSFPFLVSFPLVYRVLLELFRHGQISVLSLQALPSEMHFQSSTRWRSFRWPRVYLSKLQLLTPNLHCWPAFLSGLWLPLRVISCCASRLLPIGFSYGAKTVWGARYHSCPLYHRVIEPLIGYYLGRRCVGSL